VAVFQVPTGKRIKNTRFDKEIANGCASYKVSHVEANSAAEVLGLQSASSQLEYTAKIQAMQLPRGRHEEHTHRGLVLTGSRSKGIFRGGGKLEVVVQVLLEADS